MAPRGNKLNTIDPFLSSFQLMFMLPYISIVKIPLGPLTLRWATASSMLVT